MARTKQYDRDELLDIAVEVFRSTGFNGTSTADLVDDLGVNRKTMYAEFGSKQGLFEATLEHYHRKHLTRMLADIEDSDAGLDAIAQAFENYAAASDGPFNGRGCLMCNTAVERAAHDPASGAFTAAYLDRINSGFRQTLQNGVDTGALDDTADLDALAAFLTTALIGIAASVRAKAPSDQVHAAARVAATTIDAHRIDR